MGTIVRWVVIAAALAIVPGCAGSGDTSNATAAARLPFVSPPSTTTTVATTTTALDPSPKVTLTCPPDDSGRWSSYRAEFGVDVESTGFEKAKIQYGDGKSYQSFSWDDAERNMFWHDYQAPGSFFVSVEITDTAGREGRGTCIFNWDEPRTPQPIRTPTESVPQTPPPECDPNYSGGCVPIASDVDCSGGSGNGPAYVRGPVYVIGSDIYGLDRDNDGIGCE